MSAGQYTPGAGEQPEPANPTPADRAGYPTPADRTDRAGMPAEPDVRPVDSQPVAPASKATTAAPPERKVTRAGVIWAAVVASLVLLILLIIFILQNQELVMVKFLGFEGSVPLGMALFIAAVTGGVLVAAAGGARILQLRRNAHRSRIQQRR